MKAIQVSTFGGPEVLKLTDVPDPHIEPGKVLVDVKAVGVNPVDTYIRAGKYGPKQFPFTPGTDAAGVVAAVGDGVTTVKTGDRVYVYGGAPGAYAAKVLCDSARVYPLPDRLSFEQGAAVGVPYATAYRAAFIRGQARAGESVLVNGATGSVGQAACQLLVRAGLDVFATGGSDEGLTLVRNFGVSHVFNYHTAGYRDGIVKQSGGGVNLILETVANKNLSDDLPMLAKHGRVVVIGSQGTVEINPRDLMSRDTDIRGMSLMHSDAAELKGIHMALGAGFADGTLTPVVAKSFPLADAAKAHEAVSNGGSNGKIVLTP